MALIIDVTVELLDKIWKIAEGYKLNDKRIAKME